MLVAGDRMFGSGSGGMTLFLIFILLYLGQKGSLQGHQCSENNGSSKDVKPAAEKKYAVGLADGEVAEYPWNNTDQMEQGYAGEMEGQEMEFDSPYDIGDQGDVVQPQVEMDSDEELVQETGNEWMGGFGSWEPPVEKSPAEGFPFQGGYTILPIDESKVSNDPVENEESIEDEEKGHPDEPILGGQNKLFLYPSVKNVEREKGDSAGPKVSIKFQK